MAFSVAIMGRKGNSGTAIMEDKTKQVMKEITELRRNVTDAFNALKDAKNKVEMRHADLAVAEKKLAEKFKELGLTTLDILLESYRPDPTLPGGIWIMSSFRVDRTKVRCSDIILPDFVNIFYAERDDNTQCWGGTICYPHNQAISDRDRELWNNPIFRRNKGR